MTYFADAERSKPDSGRSFFKNYYDHYKHTDEKLERLFGQSASEPFLSALIDELPNYIKVVDPLIDVYDYMDEIMGATIIPIALGAIGPVVCILGSVYEIALGLATLTGLVKKNEEDDEEKSGHIMNAIAYLGLAILAILAAAVSLLKSAVSLFTRPISTLIRGFKQNDDDRFYDNSAYQLSM